jgi:dTDP-4-dehydrorhamnose 3,5-epimerase
VFIGRDALERPVIFTRTKLDGAFIIDLEKRTDERGFFARAFCQREFYERGLKALVAQVNIASNLHKGTLRGIHLQYPPAADTKLVRCTRGAIFFALIDLRPESGTYLQHITVELNHKNMTALYVPARFANGYQVLCDGTDICYLHSEFYNPSAEGGLMYDDPFLKLGWPLPVSVISPRDQEYRPLAEMEAEIRRRMSLT